MRYALRVDSNQTEIVDALLAAGYTVQVIGKPVDLMVGSPRTMKYMLMEVKVANGKKTKFQKDFFERWAGYPVSLVDSPESALRHARLVLGVV